MTVLIAILSVLAALVSSGATVYALTFTQQQVDITRHGLIADRFNKAGDQLGSEKSDVRTVAVLALGQIMAEDSSYSPIIVDVLAAFIRAHAPRVPDKDRPQPDPAGWGWTRPYLDVQAALTVLAHRSTGPNDNRDIDLRKTNLPGADLRNANLDNINFTGANLEGADLTNAKQDRVILADATMQGVKGLRK